MLPNCRYLVLAFQLWAMTSTCVCAQLGNGLLEPPYSLRIIGNSGMDNNIGFACLAANGFSVNDWILYRNGVPENTTDPCTSPGKDANGFLTISSMCDGHYSCGAQYTNAFGNTEFVLSGPLTVYGTYAFGFMFAIQLFCSFDSI